MVEGQRLSLGLAAVRIGGGVQIFHLQRLAKLGRIPFESVGRFRVVRVADLERIRKVCAEAGYLLQPDRLGAGGASNRAKEPVASVA